MTPTALYGAASWAMTVSRDKFLRAAQRKPSGSEVSYEEGDVALDDDECLETWVKLKQRTKGEV